MGGGAGVISAQDAMSEAVRALMALGFTRPAARRAVEKCVDDAEGDVGIEELIRGALRHT